MDAHTLERRHSWQSVPLTHKIDCPPSTPVPTWGLAHWTRLEPKASGALEEAREVESLVAEKDRALEVSEAVHIDDKDDPVEIGEFALVVDKEGVLEEVLEADKDDALEGGLEQMLGDVVRGEDEHREMCSVKIDFSRQLFEKREDILYSGNVRLFDFALGTPSLYKSARVRVI